jgi:hypothetical protein
MVEDRTDVVWIGVPGFYPPAGRPCKAGGGPARRSVSSIEFPAAREEMSI